MRDTRLKVLQAVGLSAALLISGFAFPSAKLIAQTTSVSPQDSQTDANVVAALGTSKSLSNVAINTSTVNGVVTLTGTVRDESQKELAETLTAHAAGVKSVVNNLTVTPVSASGVQDTPSQDVPATAVLMSDGTMSDGSTPDANAGQQQGSGQPSVAGAPADQNSAPPQGPNGASNGPVLNRPPYAPNGQPQYAQAPPPPPRPAQVGGKQVTVAQGSMLRVRTLEPLDAKDVKAGTTFNAVVLNDVMAGGAIAIPRGASLVGTVTEAKKAGVFGGSGKLVITLNSVAMGGQSYTIASDAWSNLGPNKTGQTVGSAIGLGAVGALIGAAAGGGSGAAIGAAAGGATGIAASGASPTRQAYIPAEAVLIFHLQKPIAVTTVGQDELNRLAQNVPPVQNQQPHMIRRGYYGYPPPPPAYYYGGYGYYRY